MLTTKTFLHPEDRPPYKQEWVRNADIKCRLCYKIAYLSKKGYQSDPLQSNAAHLPCLAVGFNSMPRQISHTAVQTGAVFRWHTDPVMVFILALWAITATLTAFSQNLSEEKDELCRYCNLIRLGQTCSSKEVHMFL